jgi:hypothetical protein
VLRKEQNKKLIMDMGIPENSKIDPELQEFLMIEKQKAQVNAQVKLEEIS